MGDEDATQAAPAGVSVDLVAAAELGTGRGALRSLAGPQDLDANLVCLPAGEEVPEHENSEGDLVVDGRQRALRPGTLAHVPRGARRPVRAGEDLAYLTVHRRRGGLGVRPKAAPPGAPGRG